MKRLLQAATVLAAVGLVWGAGMPSAGASDTVPLDCLASGTVQAQPNPDGTATWTVDGGGTCQGDFEGTYQVSLHGTGTSIGLSQCTDSPITQDFSLAVQVSVTSPNGTHTFNQTWSLPVDNYSARTLFLIGGDSSGAGYIGHNIFLACPGDGTPSATYAFSFVG